MGRTKEVMAQVFSGAVKVYDTFLTMATFGGIHRWQRELIDKMGRRGNWLDVGTGTGEVLRKLGDYPYLRVGIDLSEEMLRKAKEKCPDCHFVLADAENMPFREGSFERVSLSLVFRHLEDQRKFLRELKRVTRRGAFLGLIDIRKFRGAGILTLLMRTLFLPVGLVLFGKDKWDFFIHSIEKSFTLEEVRDLLKEEGFEVIYTCRRFFGLIYILVAERI